MTKVKIVELFSKRLAALRQKRGFTKKKMAFELGVSPAYYADLESGVREPGQSLGKLVELLILTEEAADGVEFAKAEGEIERAMEPGAPYEAGASPWLAKATSEMAFIDRYGTGMDRRLVMGAVESVYEDLTDRIERAYRDDHPNTHINPKRKEPNR